MNKQLITCAGFALLSATAFADTPPPVGGTATATASAIISGSTNMSSGRNMYFGTFLPDVNSAGVLRLSPNGGLKGVSGSVSPGTGGGTPAGFTVTGLPGGHYTVKLPTIDTSSPVTLSDSAVPAHTMTIDTFTYAPSGNDWSSVSTPLGDELLGSDGNGYFAVGANLNIRAGQVAGSYSGSFTVTVNFD